MADITALHDAPRGNIFLRAALSFWGWLAHLGETSARARAMHALCEMSDDELAKIGMKREDIAKRILTDGYYI